MADHGQSARGSCVLEVEADCQHCQRKLGHIMSTISNNNYDVIIDAERGIASVKAEVDPATFYNAVTLQMGKHGKLVESRITGVDEARRRNEVNHGCRHRDSSYDYNHNYNYNNQPLLEGRTSGGAYDAPLSYSAGDGVVIYPNGYDEYPRQYSNYVPSYPPQQGPCNHAYNYSDMQYGSNSCTIL